MARAIIIEEFHLTSITEASRPIPRHYCTLPSLCGPDRGAAILSHGELHPRCRLLAFSDQNQLLLLSFSDQTQLLQPMLFASIRPRQLRRG